MSSPDDVRNEPFECLAAITAAMVTVAGPRRTHTGFLEIGRCIDPPTSWHHTTTRPGSAPACQGEQTVKTEMLLNGVGQHVDHLLAALPIPDGTLHRAPRRSGMLGSFGQPGAPEIVTFEGTMPHRPPDTSDADSVEEGLPRRQVDIHSAVMDLVAADLDPPPGSARDGQGLVGTEGHLDRQ